MAPADEGASFSEADYVTFFSLLLRPLLRFLGRKARPQTQGTIQIPGLKESVKVLWDSYAVPHLFAANERDLFIAQGFLHAQERLWQMDLSRRLLTGRLAETLGEYPVPWREVSVRFRDKTTVDLDHFIRLIGLRRSAAASLSALPSELTARLLAYGEGINRYIETHLNSLPVEFRLLRYEPEPWRPEDSLIIGKGFAFFLSTSLYTRLTLMAIAEKLAGQEEKLRSLYPAYPAGAPSITRSTAEDAGKLFHFVNGTFHRTGLLADRQGSNNWVVATARSVTEKPILCNDPHLRLTLPSVWYLMHLRAEPEGERGEAFEVWGGSIPGSPGVHIGHNRWIAWGVTAALCDDGELYREKIHPEDPELYRVGDQWAKMGREEEKIKIRAGKEISKIVRFTRHGPVLSDLANPGPAEEVLAFRWTAHDPSQEFRVLDGIDRARDWNEFLESLSYQVAPSLSYVYADRQGNIGYALAGRVPIRAQSGSFLPLPGWTGESDWKGYIPFSQLPRLYNPPEGVIATANNRIVDDSYPHYLSDLFDPPYRIRRIRELLTAKEKFSLEDMAAMQQDVVSLQAREMIRGLKSDLEETGRRNPALKQSIERLTRWDGACSCDSPEAALSHLFHHRLMMSLLAPDLGEELAHAYVEIFNQALLPINQILGDPQSPWFASCPRRALVEKCLREAQEEISGRLGADMEQWSWGRLHTLTLQHPFGRSKLLAPLFSLGPFPSPGDGVTVNMGFYRQSNPYEHVVGASLRMIVDLGDWRRSLIVLSSGQSGHFFSPHYSDLTELWRRGAYIRLFHGEEEMRDWPVLILRPRLTPA